MDNHVPERLQRMRNLQTVYAELLSYPGLGPFLAFQYVIDLNYSTLLNFAEADFVGSCPGEWCRSCG
jgi:hypothetical protein